MSARIDALEAIERVVATGGEADDVLRRVVAILHKQIGCFVGISFIEGGEPVPGPAAGQRAGTTMKSFPIAFQGRRVADLDAGGELSPETCVLLERVATLLAPYALVGWDTGGEEWTP